MPEAIGFNLAYEQLAYHLLVTIHELKELRIDPYYFVLHVYVILYLALGLTHLWQCD